MRPIKQNSPRGQHLLRSEPTARFDWGAKEQRENSEAHRAKLEGHGFKKVTGCGSTDAHQGHRYEIYHHPKTGHIAVHCQEEGWTRVHHHQDSAYGGSSHGHADDLHKHLKEEVKGD